MSSYLFQSERLGFRCWQPNDLNKLHQIFSDPEVMKYFPSALTLQETSVFITRMVQEYENRGYCYYALDLLQNKECIGFIGLKLQEYEAEFNPSVDIGWRLDKKYHGRGLATEGASQCLAYAFSELGLKEIVAVAPEVNKPSINVMHKIGMNYIETFIHPLLTGHEALQKCVLYKIKSP